MSHLSSDIKFHDMQPTPQAAIFSHASAFHARSSSKEAHTDWQREKIDEILAFTNDHLCVILSPHSIQGEQKDRIPTNCYAKDEIKALGEASAALIKAVGEFKSDVY